MVTLVDGEPVASGTTERWEYRLVSTVDGEELISPPVDDPSLLVVPMRAGARWEHRRVTVVASEWHPCRRDEPAAVAAE